MRLVISCYKSSKRKNCNIPTDSQIGRERDKRLRDLDVRPSVSSY